MSEDAYTEAKGAWPLKAPLAASLIVHALALMLVAALGLRGDSPSSAKAFYVNLKAPPEAAAGKGKIQKAGDANPPVVSKRHEEARKPVTPQPVAPQKDEKHVESYVQLAETPAPSVKEGGKPAEEDVAVVAGQPEAPLFQDEAALAEIPFEEGAGTTSGEEVLRVELPVTGGTSGEQAVDDYGGERMRLIFTAIRDAVLYPSLARKRGLEGTVLAGFSIDGKGMPEDIEIISSSGHGILDREVVRSIRRVAPYPLVKERIEVPVSFRLSEGEGVLW